MMPHIVSILFCSSVWDTAFAGGETLSVNWFSLFNLDIGFQSFYDVFLVASLEQLDVEKLNFTDDYRCQQKL